ncbi:hypothetical protein [Bacillus cereus group sp. N21]|uniref:hypothetical protein n=1 Tax=Bacillus cereus group sp. N21 TaxID=2794591 RepID=UPI0018F28201|nr:hypothetical protein [Bacillus cereus group sp. N21]MBJ8031847.1 hypothetical protein [Bacillus cereus group sp. N21]
MEYQVWVKENLEDLAKTRGFSLVNGNIHINVEKDNQIEIPNLEEFLDFHVYVENKLLFYMYIYDRKENYVIPDEYHQKYEDAIQEQVSAEIYKYNKMLSEINFEKPASVLIYYIKDGFLFFNYTERVEIGELCEYDDMVNIIVEEIVQEIPEEKLEEIKNNRKNKIDKQLIELKECIFADPEFKIATNDLRRRRYASQFFEDRSGDIELIRRAGYHHQFLFIEDIWREFKAKGLHK